MPFAATEKLLMQLVKAGADRQNMHDVIRGHALVSWAAVQQGGSNPLVDLLGLDQKIQEFLPEEGIKACLSDFSYLGDAVKRSRDLAKRIKKEISS